MVTRPQKILSGKERLMGVIEAGSCRPIDVFNPAMEINCPEVQFQN